MAFWKRLLGLVPTRPAGDLDPALGDAAARRMIAALKAGDLSALSLVAGQREGAWNERTFYADLAAEHVPADALGDDALSLVLRGARKVDEGGRRLQAQEPKSTWRGVLEEADRDLARAAEIDPDDPTPWAFRMSCSLGLGRREAAARPLFEQAVAREPECWYAHRVMLRASCRKWGGSHEGMFAFARAAAAARPEGFVPLVVVEAHLERWYSLFSEADADAAAAYVKTPSVRAECKVACERALARPRRPSSIVPLNVAAYWAFVARDVPLLSKVLPVVGNAATDSPWNLSKGGRAAAFPRAWKLVEDA